VSIFVLISGVVLLTHKKPEPKSLSSRSTAALGSVGPRLELRQRSLSARKGKAKPKGGGVDDRDDEETMVDGEEEVLWGVGDASDEEDSGNDGEGQDDDVDHHQHPMYKGAGGQLNGNRSRSRLHGGEEGEGLLPDRDEEELEDFAPPPAHPFRDTLEP
jgi:hypothetical protein